jgi:hypothetical protein
MQSSVQSFARALYGVLAELCGEPLVELLAEPLVELRAEPCAKP